MSIVKNIYTGWKNYIFKDSNIEPLALSRAAICTGEDDNTKKCRYYKRFAGGSCSKCFCFIEAKVRCVQCSCPDSRW